MPTLGEVPVDYYQNKLEEAKFFLDLMRNYEGAWEQAQEKLDDRAAKKTALRYTFAFSAFLNAVYSADQFMEKIAPESERKREWLRNSKRGEDILRFFKAIRADATHNYVLELGKNYEVDMSFGIRRSHIAPDYFVPEPGRQRLGPPRLGIDPAKLSPETAKLHSKYLDNRKDRGSLTFCCDELYVTLHKLLMYGMGEGHIPT
ncbi:MAG: hypothetical protein ACYDGW_10755 [Vulcanimicrobiaceae bacterium]